MKEILIASIPPLITLIGVIITVAVGSANTNHNIEQQTALTLYRLEQVEKKQDKHNNLIERVYKNEQDIEVIKVRIEDIEKKSD